MMPFRFVLLLLPIILAAPTTAAQPGPVAWTVNAEPGTVAPGGLLTVTVQGEIEEGWRVYAMDSEAGHPLQITLDVPDGTQALGSQQQAQPREGFDHWFESDYTFFSKHVTVTQAFRMGEAARGDLSLSGTITYMACSDEVCLPARREEVGTRVKVGNTGR